MEAPSALPALTLTGVSLSRMGSVQQKVHHLLPDNSCIIDKGE